MFILLSRRQIYQRVALVVGFLLLAASLSWAGSGALAAWATGQEERPLTRADSPDDRVALTFDVTFGQDELNKILATLDAGQVKGTFFVGGTFLTLRGDLVKQIAAKGHEIGTLGERIVDLSQYSEEEVASNLLASQSSLSKILGGPVRYFRPPQGEATPAVVRSARSAGLITITKSLDSEDHYGAKASVITDRVVKRAKRGDIILLSASDWSRETAKALPGIIKGLKDRGFKLVLVSELVPANLKQ